MGDRRHARQRRDARALRRRARLSRARPAVGLRRAPSGQRARRVADVDPGADGARRRAGPRARPVVAAHPGARPANRGTRRRGTGTSTSSAAAAARSSTSRAAPRSARASCRRTSSQPLSPCSLGGPALGMAVDVFDEQRPPGARRGRRARVHEAVAGDDARVCTAIRERYLETYWSRWPDVWWHGDFASVTRRRPVVPARPLRRHDQGSRASGSGRPRSRRWSSRIPRCSRRPRSACPTS